MYKTRWYYTLIDFYFPPNMPTVQYNILIGFYYHRTKNNHKKNKNKP